jgi:hypothetical protein
MLQADATGWPGKASRVCASPWSMESASHVKNTRSAPTAIIQMLPPSSSGAARRFHQRHALLLLVEDLLGPENRQAQGVGGGSSPARQM